jgi:hypothetical protein
VAGGSWAGGRVGAQSARSMEALLRVCGCGRVGWRWPEGTAGDKLARLGCAWCVSLAGACAGGGCSRRQAKPRAPAHAANRQPQPQGGPAAFNKLLVSSAGLPTPTTLLAAATAKGDDGENGAKRKAAPGGAAFNNPFARKPKVAKG